MKTFQEFITEGRSYPHRRRRAGGDPFTRYSSGKEKPLDLSWIHKASDEDAAATLKAKKKREKESKQADTRRRMDAAGKKLGLPEEFVDPEHGEAPSGRSPLQNVSDHPKASVRKKAVKAFRTQMGKEYGGKWKSRSNDPVSEEHIDELFITRKSSEEKTDERRKKKVAELIRLMKHAKDPSSDVAKKVVKTEEYIDETSLSRVVSKTQKGGISIMSSDRGDKTNKEKKERSKRLVNRIRGAGLPGPTKVKGAYHEKDHGEQTEKSFVVGSGKTGKRKFKKLVTKLGQEGGLKHKRNQNPSSKKDDQDSVLIKQKSGLGSKASWLGTSRRSDADPKLGKKEDQGKLSTRDANKPLKPGEGATKVGKKRLQFK